MNQPFSLAARLRSLRYALNGILLTLRSQHNTWIHAAATVIVTVAGFCFGLSGGEWCCIVLAIMAVWTAEALNTALEFLADATSPFQHPLVGKAKDVAAGAVLLSAIGSAVIGVIVLGPHVRSLL